MKTPSEEISCQIRCRPRTDSLSARKRRPSANTAMQSQKAVSADFKKTQMLFFSFARQNI